MLINFHMREGYFFLLLPEVNQMFAVLKSKAICINEFFIFCQKCSISITGSFIGMVVMLPSITFHWSYCINCLIHSTY